MASLSDTQPEKQTPRVLIKNYLETETRYSDVNNRRRSTRSTGSARNASLQEMVLRSGRKRKSMTSQLLDDDEQEIITPRTAIQQYVAIAPVNKSALPVKHAKKRRSEPSDLRRSSLAASSSNTSLLSLSCRETPRTMIANFIANADVETPVVREPTEKESALPPIPPHVRFSKFKKTVVPHKSAEEVASMLKQIQSVKPFQPKAKRVWNFDMNRTTELLSVSESHLTDGDMTAFFDKSYKARKSPAVEVGKMRQQQPSEVHKVDQGRGDGDVNAGKESTMSRAEERAQTSRVEQLATVEEDGEKETEAFVEQEGNLEEEAEDEEQEGNREEEAEDEEQEGNREEEAEDEEQEESREEDTEEDVEQEEIPEEEAMIDVEQDEIPEEDTEEDVEQEEIPEEEAMIDVEQDEIPEEDTEEDVEQEEIPEEDVEQEEILEEEDVEDVEQEIPEEDVEQEEISEEEDVEDVEQEIPEEDVEQEEILEEEDVEDVEQEIPEEDIEEDVQQEEIREEEDIEDVEQEETVEDVQPERGEDTEDNEEHRGNYETEAEAGVVEHIENSEEEDEDVEEEDNEEEETNDDVVRDKDIIEKGEAGVAAYDTEAQEEVERDEESEDDAEDDVERSEARGMHAHEDIEQAEDRVEETEGDVESTEALDREAQEHTELNDDDEVDAEQRGRERLTPASLRSEARLPQSQQRRNVSLRLQTSHKKSSKPTVTTPRRLSRVLTPHKVTEQISHEIGHVEGDDRATRATLAGQHLREAEAGDARVRATESDPHEEQDFTEDDSDEEDAAEAPPRRSATRAVQPATSRRPANPRQKLFGELPVSMTKFFFSLFSQRKVARDAWEEVLKCERNFFVSLSADLYAYARHAGRHTIQVEDVELLMKRQGFINDKVCFSSLVEKHLPLEYRRLLLPCAQSRNAGRKRNAVGK